MAGPLSFSVPNVIIPAAIGTTVNYTPAISGGDAATTRFGYAGRMPAGLSINPNTGQISGTVTESYERRRASIFVMDKDTSAQQGVVMAGVVEGPPAQASYNSGMGRQGSVVIPYDPNPPVSGGGGSVTVMRAGIIGGDNSNQLGSTGAAQSSAVSREPMLATHDFSYIEVDIPTWVFNVSGAITENDLAEAYTFGVVLEYPFTAALTAIPTNTRYRLTDPNGSNYSTYSGTPGAVPYIRFKAQLPMTIPAGAKFGLWVTQECVAGRTGAVTNKLLVKAQQGSSFTNRYQGFVNAVASTTSYVDTDFAMTGTALTAVTALQTGGVVFMGAGVVRTAFTGTEPSILVDGNSIEAGNQEGYGNSLALGDANGDANSNRGWATRLCSKLGLAVTQMSKGSDSEIQRAISGNYARRLAQYAAVNPTHLIMINPHNDISGSPGAPTNWAANTAYGIDTAVTANATQWVSLNAGTSGASGGPSGTTTVGDVVTDGTMQWFCLGSRTANIAPGGQTDNFAMWVARKRSLIRQIRAVLPTTKLIGSTETPDTALTQTQAITATSYVSGTGVLTVTVADTSMYLSSQQFRLGGLGTGFNTSSSVGGIVGTVASSTTITFQLATGLAAPASTGTIDGGCTTVAGQVLRTAFTPGNSYRSLANQFLRSSIGQTYLGLAAIADIGKWTEAGNPVTAATETGAWGSLTDANGNTAFVMTSDRTHPTSKGYDYIATQLAADTNLVNVLRSVS